MSFNLEPRRSLYTTNSPNTSPSRHRSNASNASSALSSYSMVSDQSHNGLSRTSTISSATSSLYSNGLTGLRRDIERGGGPPSPSKHGHGGSMDNTPTRGSPGAQYKSARSGLRPLPQPPNAPATPPVYHNEKVVSPSKDDTPRSDHSWSNTPTQSPAPLPKSGLGASPRPRQVSGHKRSESEAALSPSPRTGRGISHQKHQSLIAPPDLAEFKGSSTKELRTLGRLAQEGNEDFTNVASVVGLNGRRRLQRNNSVRPQKARPTSTWAANNWMDQQRKFLQAYEYLCHIGEAKEWIEDIIHKPIPPIVQLEEALRDGVTLAEVVQALKPDRRVKIFINPKLQFRHSDNIAAFFRFLDEVELPDVFRFELTDLYERKNIPKVIHCIHALSWLLFKLGMVDFKISSLVGQLQFEDHELEETQKGLDKAGVNMPSFAGMGASFGAEPEPEPEPQETEAERVDRELGENEGSITEFQTQIRGALLRMRLGTYMNGLWDVEPQIIELQARLRGDWARQIFGYRRDMRRFAVNLQSAARGFLVRQRQDSKEEWWKSQEPQIILLQSLVRAGKARQEVSYLKSLARKQESGVKSLQAAIRGAMQRKRFDAQYEQTQRSQHELPKLQAAIRAMQQRREHQKQISELHYAQPSVVKLQAAIRARQSRSQQSSQMDRLEKSAPAFVGLQAALRGLLARKVNHGVKEILHTHNTDFSRLQAKIRGDSIRLAIEELREDLQAASPDVVSLQAAIRAQSSRQQRQREAAALKSQEGKITTLQAHTRAILARAKNQALKEELEIHTGAVIKLQALSKAMIIRLEIGALLEELDEHEEMVEQLQSLARGALLRAKFAEKQKYFRENMEKVIKVQSFVRGKLQGQAYKSLTSGKNPPVNTVKNFVHLLNDSDLDFDEELEFERLRKTVIQHVRQNEMASEYIAQLDIKIALLVKNKITLDEVVKHQKHFGGHMGSILHSRDFSSKDPFDLKALNKNSRRKLEQYQEFFFILQTQPQYLAKLFRKIREQALPEQEGERIKHLVMGTFGYAQKRREEYYLIKLLSKSIKEEVEASRNLQDYLRSNFFWQKVFGAYANSPRDRKYMRDVLGPIIKENVLDDPDLDLESDPLQIYRQVIDNEQLRTGQRSAKRQDVSREEAIRDPETKQAFIRHLQDLRGICEQVQGSVHELMHKMPFGVRYVAQQMYVTILEKYNQEDPAFILQIVGNWVWKNYLQPAIFEPEKHGVVDRGLMPEQKKNLSEITKVLAQVASGRSFGQENVFLQPLNTWIKDSIANMTETWKLLIDVPTAETQFDIDEFNDLYAKTKPTLYIKMADILAIHHLIAQDTAYLCTQHDDSLKDVVRELGNVKANESELMSVGSSEICLTLNPKLHEQQDPNAHANALWMEAKRCSLYIIRVQSGQNLKDIMVKPVTIEDEDKWAQIVADELSTNSHRRGAYTEANTLTDLATLSYAQLKMTALENIMELQQLGCLTPYNNYQDLLNTIAVDIRTKHRRRIQRQRELEGVRMTLQRLDEQAEYLEGQLKTYNDYIEQAMMTLQNKKGKKRFLLPFTKQWDHERELARSGRVPKFGSYKYSAAELANRGIVVAWGPYPERAWGGIDLTISSNAVGVFTLEGSSGSISLPGASAQVPLDDLLQAQYNNTQFLEFFGQEQVKVNVNLFLHLIMRKFYKDRE